MSNPVGGQPDPNQPSLSPNLEGDPSNRVASVANEVFSRSGGASSLPDSLSSRVSVGEVRLSKEDILNQWLASQPENAKAEAQQILAILRQKNLDNPFELELGNLKNITSLPNVLQNCKDLICRGCTSLQALPALPDCRTLNCSDCTSLQALPELPVCQKLICSNCTSLQALPELPVCVWLNCDNCTSLQALPELPVCKGLACVSTSLRELPELPACDTLFCFYCTSLQTLPALPVCTRLGCDNCTSLQTLPALPVCSNLACVNCTSLQALPALPDCRTLDCRDCTSLQALPELPVCDILNCSNCTSLQTLPELPVCDILNCSNCTSIQALPELTVCKTLRCIGCTSLQALPELTVCRELWCVACTSLRELPELPVCETLDCSGCTSLQALPALPRCLRLNCDNCPLLLPQVQQPDLPQVQQSNPYQGRIDRAAQGTLQDALSFWSSLLPQGQAQLLGAEDLQLSEADQRLFQIFLNRLQETNDFREANPQNFALRVATIVRDMATSEEFREKAIIALGEANESCGDRVATGINNLELLSLMYGENKPKTDVDTACLAIRLARLDQVRKKAMELNQGAEGLETVLFLELKLKDPLQLPLQTEGMLYPAIGRVQDQVVERTAQEILAATSTDKQLVDILVNSSVWTDFLQREYAFFYGDVLEGLEIIANLAEGTDYAANLAALEKEPTNAWTQFLDNVGPPNASTENREALRGEVLEVLREACPDLTGKDYNTAYNRLIQMLHHRKTVVWLEANYAALRAKLKPGA